MTWTKLSDDFSDDCWELSDEAFRLHVEGLLWSARKLLDLVLAKDEMHRWAKHPEAVSELVERGYWRDEGDGRYRIVHHACYQRSRAQEMRRQEANRANAHERWRPRASKPQSKPQCDSHNDWQSESDSQSDSQCEMDGTGRDGPGTEGDQLTKRDDEISEPPEVDADGFPLEYRW